LSAGAPAAFRRLSRRVAFRATGPGWQTKINRLHHVAVEAQFERHLGVGRFGPTDLAAANVRLRLTEPLLGQLGYFLILFGRDRQRVSILQIAANITPNGLFPGHWPSSSNALRPCHHHQV
jgi:hypothetical protein